MKKIATFLFSLLTLVSGAQITLFDSDFPSVGDSIFLARNNNISTPITAGAGGMNTWNFSNIGFGQQDTIVFLDPSITSFVSTFSNATEVVQDQDDLLFFVKTPGTRALDGIVTDLFNNGSAVAFDLSPNLTELNFPASYLDSLTITSVIDSTIDTNITMPIAIDSIRFKRTYVVNSMLDGYGSVTTPAGTFNSLRQYKFEDIRDTTWVHSPLTGWSLSPLNPTSLDSVHQYNWFATNERYAVMSVETATKSGNITSSTFQLGGSLSASISFKQDASCNSACDGLIFADAVGGTQPYSYQWSQNTGNQTNDTATGLCAGVYSVTVFDALGDSVVANMQINQPNPLVIDTLSITPESSFGNDGAISTTINGGTSPYSFNWSTSDTTQNLTGLTAGTYNATVTDANGCTDTLSVVVPSNALALALSLDSTKIASCFGNCDGEAFVSAAGGIGTYTFQWDANANNQTAANATSLCAGTYAVTVFDSNGDSAVINNVSIQQPTQLLADTVSVTPESGAGNDGAIDAFVQGGTPPYTYAWSNGDTTQDISNLTTGSYSLTVTDENGCQTTLTVTVPSSGPLQGIAYYNSDFGNIGDQVYMARDLNPSMLDLISNGNTNWNFGGLKIQAIDTLDFLDPSTTTYGPLFQNSNLVIANGVDTSYHSLGAGKLTTEGIYGDPFGLNFSAVIDYEPALTLIEFPAIFGNSFTSTALVDTSIDTTVQVFDSIRVKRAITHNGSVDGYGNMTIPAGTFNSIRQKTQQIVIDSIWGWNLFTGWQNIAAFNNYDTTYRYQWFASGEEYPIVEIISENETSGIISASFKLGNNLLASIIDQNDVLCNGDCNGSAVAQAITGTPPFNYYWDANTGNQTGPFATNLCPNTYFVTVVDAANDSVLTSATIGEPAPLVVNLDSIITETDPGSNGGILISVTGGNPPYNYVWSDGQTSKDATGLAQGTYTVTVSDLNNCNTDGTYTVDSKVSVEEIGKQTLKVYPNPASFSLYLENKTNEVLSFTLIDMIGNRLMEDINLKSVEKIDVSMLPPGVYFLQLSNKEGVLRTQKINVVR